MALRVLLADESTTIKKVMQLALQDFAVEVKAVHSGVDVLEVARSFAPDLIFADVLLQKKNGYEVAQDLKRDPQLKVIPVVLMWSSFMDLDEKLANASGADKRLEKPFDIENLRQLILELVPRTRSQRLAHFLKFPESFAEPLKNEVKGEEEKKRPAPETNATIASGLVTLAQPPTSVTYAPPASETVTGRTSTTMTQATRTLDPGARMPGESTPAIPLPPPRLSEERPSAPHVDKPAETPVWNMESFEDIGAFAERESFAEVEQKRLDDLPSFGGLELTPPPTSSATDEDDAGFAELRLSGTSDPRTERPLETEPRPARADERDPWSHQDLSRFKIDLPPVSMDGDNGPLEFELPENAGDDTGMILREAPWRNAREDERPLGPGLELDSDDADGHASFEIEDTPPDRSASGLQLTRAEDFDPADASRVSDGIPQLSPERLEQIIRAQSREIIEQVVQRIVPDIAADIIRSELQRLLEDTAVRPDKKEQRK